MALHRAGQAGAERLHRIKVRTASCATSVSTSTCSAASGEAREIIERWRHDYNHLRPHSSLGYTAPEEFAARNHGFLASARTTWPAQMLAAAVQGAPASDPQPDSFSAALRRVKGGRKNWYEHETTTTNDTPWRGRKITGGLYL